MKITLLQHLSGTVSYEAGDEIDVSEAEALRFISKGIAKAKTHKAHNDLMAKAEKLEKEASDKQAKIIALQKEDELKGEANELLDELVAVVTTIATQDKKYIAGFLTEVSNRLKAN